MKYGFIICTLLFVAGVVLCLVQLWFSPMEAALFMKLLLTIGALLVVALVITLVAREYLGEKDMKKNGYID